ncbi:MAG: hypothetical protein OD918_02130, partial [Gammaproteobacteria bacterium]
MPPAPASAPALDLSSGKSAHAKNQRKLLVNAAYLVGVTALVAAALFYAPSLLQRGDSDAPRPRETAQPDSAPALDPAAQKLRAQFMRELTQYESETEPKIAALHLQQWAAGQHAQLAELKMRAVERFAASEYAAALEELRRAREAAAA